MSKMIKQSILILGILVALSVAFAIIFYLQKQSAESRVSSLSNQITQYEVQERDLQKKLAGLQADSEKLRRDLGQRDGERDDLMKKSEDARREVSRLMDDITKVQKERADWDGKLSNLRHERDELIRQVTELKNRPVTEKIVEKIVYRDRPAASGDASGEGAVAGQAGNDGASAAVNGGMPSGTSRENELYWAGILRQKAALELELRKSKEDLNNTNIQVAELKKGNTDLDMELGRIKNERDEIVRKIKYGEDLADNLSVELARARNEQKLSLDRAAQLVAENQQLRLDIKQLTTTKVALEKSIASLSDEKGAVEKKLVETENIIQNRIDEVWQIKKDIDTRFDGRGAKASTGEVELAPIVVNKGDTVPSKPAPAQAKAASKSAQAKKLQGSIVSVNEENNFVIVNLGEKSGINVGDAFRVYHNGAPIGAVEVIQVRQDISAADIRQKTAALAVGDIVR